MFTPVLKRFFNEIANRQDKTTQIPYFDDNIGQRNLFDPPPIDVDSRLCTNCVAVAMRISFIVLKIKKHHKTESGRLSSDLIMFVN
jgi:hypothetical protein